MNVENSLKKYSDPRRYNLILALGAERLQAWFTPFGHPEALPEPGLSMTLTPDADNELRRIENAVYDHSEILEEYDTRLLIHTPRILCVPPSTPPQVITAAMKRIYDAEAADVYTRQHAGATVAFTLCRGIKGFLGRTFAGVEPDCGIGPLLDRFASLRTPADTTRVYADLDGDYMHLMAFESDRLLHASVHRTPEPADAAYFIFALWQQLGLAADEGELNVSGPRERRRQLMPMLRRHLNYVALTPLPRVEGAETIPAAVLLESVKA